MKYFTLEELGAEKKNQFHPGFIKHLDSLREAVGRPFVITSGARSAKYNKEIGGALSSLHIWDKPMRQGQRGCMAVDVAVTTPSFKVEVAMIALPLGWSVGVNDKKRFIHLDRRVDIGAKQALFSY